MIDKLNIQVSLYHKPIGEDYLIKYSRRQNGDGREIRLKHWHKGSHDSKIAVRSTDIDTEGMAHSLLIAGNPLKWFQGHNLFGTSDALSISICFIFSALRSLNIQPSKKESFKIFSGFFKVREIHTTKCYKLESHQQVAAWIRQAADAGTSRLKGTTAYEDETLYFGMSDFGKGGKGKKSRRFIIKIYAKGPELSKHQLPADLERRNDLIAYADNLLRVEVELYHMELERLGLNLGYQWASDTANKVYADKLKGVSIPENLEIPHQDFLTLPPGLRGTYLAWREGIPLGPRTYFKNRRTYYNHRSALLAYKIDIAVKPRNEEEANTIPLWDVAKMVEAPVPSWAIGTPLFYEPSASTKMEESLPPWPEVSTISLGLLLGLDVSHEVPNGKPQAAKFGH